MSYQKLLRTAREQADARLAEKGLSPTPIRRRDEEEDPIMGSLVPQRRKVEQPAAEDGFMTSFYNRLYAENKELQKQVAEATKGEGGPPLMSEPPGVSGKVDTSVSSVDLIAGFEQSGKQDTYKAYWDEKQWSIGFGTKAKSKDEVISHEEAMGRLQKEEARFRKTVLDKAEKYGYDWDDNQIKALTSFTYNLGAGNLDKLLDKGQRGDEEISTMMLEYNKAGGEVSPGLVRRRQVESDLFSSVD